uniref:Uncharacterized protein n=1 Tax=Lepeophtheirus salmonis TaxID=72036 RepID=A0A0K2U386_LEPSM
MNARSMSARKQPYSPCRNAGPSWT